MAMTRQQLMDTLRPRLNEVIGKWIEDDGNNELIGSEAGGWVGNDASRLMTEAALCVLFAQFDVQDYLKREGQLKND